MGPRHLPLLASLLPASGTRAPNPGSYSPSNCTAISHKEVFDSLRILILCSIQLGDKAHDEADRGYRMRPA
ncbi:hypothetical protein F4775DRAFT_570874 [Biscogniauxia sp. FL1348]|nr:hypothetical protein F4775DRAFT_570874 [Biscogniauxia sp. FL1348]